MGRGNYLPNTDNPYRLVYVEYPDSAYLDDVEYDMGMWYEDLKENIKSILPKSFSDSINKKWDSNDTIIISENKLFKVCLADNEHSIAVILMVNEDSPSFAEANIDKVFDKLAYDLWEMYELRIRCGAWTSGEYFPNKYKKVSVYDNGGKTYDRYTVSISGEKWNENYIYGMNDMPFHPAFGFSQFVGENLEPNKNWGKKIRLIDLNKDVLSAIEQRM